MGRIFDTPITTNDQGIDRVLAVGLPVLIVFLNGAPDIALAEALNRLAREHAGHLLLVRFPVADNPETARRFEVRALPAVAAVTAGGQVLASANSIPAGELARYAAFLLGKGPRPEPAPAAARQPGAAPAGAGRPVTVTDATFDQQVLRSPLPVVVDFWAPWCGPCRMVEPTVEKLAREQAGRVLFAKVNVDENPVVAQRYGVQSIPTMMVVRGGVIVDRWAGALPEGALRGRLAPNLG